MDDRGARKHTRKPAKRVWPGKNWGARLRMGEAKGVVSKSTH